MKSPILLICLMIIGFFSGAQELNTQPLSLKACLDLAILNHVKIKNAKLEEQKMIYKIREVRSSGLPQLNISGTFDDYLKLPTQLIPGEIFDKPGEMIPIQFGTKYNVNGNIDASQLIYSQSYFTGLKSVKELKNLNELNTEKTKEEIIYQVAQVYYSAQIILKQKENMLANLSKLEELEKIAGLQNEKGFIRKIDFDRITVSRVNLMTEINNIALLYEEQLTMLKYLMGIGQDIAVYLNDTVIAYNKNISLTNNIDNHIDMKLFEKQKKLAGLEIELNKAAYFPTLTAYGRYGYQNMQNEFVFWGTDHKWLNTSMIGLSLNIPVFNGFQKNSRIAQSVIQYEQIKLQSEDLKNYLGTEVKNVINKYERSMMTFETQAGNVKLAENVFNVTNDLYQQGLTPLTDLLNAQYELKGAQIAENQSLIQLKLAELDLLKAQGNIVTILNK